MIDSKIEPPASSSGSSTSNVKAPNPTYGLTDSRRSGVSSSSSKEQASSYGIGGQTTPTSIYGPTGASSTSYKGTTSRVLGASGLYGTTSGTSDVYQPPTTTTTTTPVTPATSTYKPSTSASNLGTTAGYQSGAYQVPSTTQTPNVPTY